MPVVPAVDLLGDEAVRLERGEFDRVLFRMPIEELLRRIVATSPQLIHVVDLDGAREGALRFDMLERCLAASQGVELQISGGVRSIEVAERALEVGAARVVVGTAAWANPDALCEFTSRLGERLVVGCDVREGLVATQGWLATTRIGVDEALERCVAAKVPRLHVTAIDRDGTLGGPDLELYRKCCSTGIPVVAAGGVRGDDDVRDLEAVGCEDVVMGLGLLGALGLSR
jgi:phosphoribosylformimino-5-aminoimidazole carboxamide ribotide isomerase